MYENKGEIYTFAVMRIILGVFGLIWKVYVALIFVITALVMYPIIVPFLTSDRNKKRAFKMFVVWSWMVRILAFYFVKFEKRSKLPQGPMLIVANHTSYLDIFLMYSVLPKNAFLFLGKSEILKYPLIKTFFKRFNIPVYRDNKRKAAKSLIQALVEVRKGWSIFIFPEGGIPDVQHPKMIPFKKGASVLAKQAQVPIVPMTFLNNYKLFSDPEQLLGPASPGVSRVQIHDYITVDTINEMSNEELSQHCFDIINEPILKEHPELYE